MLTVTKSGRWKRGSGERGQAAIFVVLALGIFLIGGVGFVVDGANLWFHRQSAQTAADAACTAGAMDMLSAAAGADLSNTAWANSVASYASLNGYPTAPTIAYPQTFGGILSSADCEQPTPVCAADQLVTGTTPPLYMQVTINDGVPTTFMRLVGAGPSINVPARSTCGLSNVLSYVPVLVLNPNVSDTLTGSGNLSVNFSAAAAKTPSKVLQVNSSDSDAVNRFGGSIDLRNADESIGDFGIAGQSTPGGDRSYTTVNAAGVVSDPFALVQAPATPPPADPVLYRQTNLDCPSGITCDIYSPGHWSGDLIVAQHGTPEGATTATGVAVFEPGIYYLEGNFIAGPNTCLRPSSSTGSLGTVFYLNGGTIQIGSGSGQLTRKGGAWNCQSVADGVQLSDLKCPTASGSNLPAGMAGNVLLGPCEAANGDSLHLHPYGDPLGQEDPIGEQRGMLFFQGRDSTATPMWNPSGSFGLIGNIYFHHCGSGSGSGANCDSTAFDDTFILGGGTGYIVGDIVVDKLVVNSGLANVSLNPNPQYYVLKASLLQ